MKNSPMPPRDPAKRLARRVPLAGGKELERGTARLKRRAELTAKPRARKAATDTGPSRKVRALVLARDGFACVRCGRSVIGIRASVHHRKRRSQGGANTPDNLAVMCGTGTTGCHGWVHAHPNWARDAGWLVRSGDDPAQVPMLATSGLLTWLAPDGEYATEPPVAGAA